MAHSNRSQHTSSRTEHRQGPTAGREWDSAADAERFDPRDAENIDLDTDCLNEALERRSQS